MRVKALRKLRKDVCKFFELLVFFSFNILSPTLSFGSVYVSYFTRFFGYYFFVVIDETTKNTMTKNDLSFHRFCFFFVRSFVFCTVYITNNIKYSDFNYSTTRTNK